MIGWAILEQMGHVRLVGELSEVEMFGAKMGRIDILHRDGTREVRFFSAASVYGIRPLAGEEAARKALDPYSYATALPAVFVSDDEGDEEHDIAIDGGDA